MTSVRSNEPYPEILERVMQADRHRLHRQWQRMQRKGQKLEESADYERWLHATRTSAQRRDQRASSIPSLDFDPELPISAHREQLVELIQRHQVIVVCGETGSGKSTQLPKLCLLAGLGRTGMIGHTQPRRLAARAVASRLADELQTKVGEKVGFKIRFSDATGPNTLVKLMTDGVLLAETQSDRFFDQYDAIIIDEAHERSLNIDLLLGYLRQISGKRPDLKIIITSATIDPQRFADHFASEEGPAPIVEVSGRTYPVEQRYRPIAGPATTQDFTEDLALRAIADATDELMVEGPGDILVFLPTERDIRIAAKHLRGHLTRTGIETEILPLYARLSQSEQNKIFAAHGNRRIVLATNVAESSLTVPGIHFVIDTGLARISRYAPRSKVQRLPIEDISQASANQRSGRCGRLGPGICIRLYGQDDFASRPKFTTPEIRRSDLASVMLQSLMLRLGPLEEFPLLDAPTPESIRDAKKTLHELGAITERGELTKIGKQLGQLPCEPRVGRMLIEASERNCLADVLIIAAGLECQDVRMRPAGQANQADEAHAEFRDPHSDFLSLIRLWDYFENLRSQLGRSRLQKALSQKFLSFHTFREWADVVRQLKDILANANMRVGKRTLKLAPVPEELEDKRSPAERTKAPNPNARIKRPTGYDSVHQSLLAGLLSGIAQRGDAKEYKAAGGLAVSLWPGSGLFRRAPRWIVAAEILETTKRYARGVAEVEPEWIEQAAGSLLKHTFYDPHWSSKTCAAMVYRKSNLYGLTVVAGRRQPLANIDRENARAMLIEHGLVGGEWKCSEKFYLHNQELIADIHELVQRTRSRDYIIDRFHLANFYNARLPLEVYDLNTLRAWIAKNRGQEAELALHMQPSDLLDVKEDIVEVDNGFPNSIQVGSTEFPLEYHFEPGHKADGVTITVPQAALRQVSDEALGWLVPGLLEEKILHLIKTLPKSQRTNFVPAPDVARKLASALKDVDRSKPFSVALSEVMRAHSGERVSTSDFEWDRLPDHLRFLVRVVDDDGQVVAANRSVSQLQAGHALEESTIRVDLNDASSTDWVNREINHKEIGEVPKEVVVRRGGVLITAFPAIIDLRDEGAERVEIRLCDTLAEADRQSRLGLVRLFSTKHNRLLKGQVNHLPGLSEASVRLSHLLSSKELREQLQELIARIALVEDQPLIYDNVDYEARNARANVQITIATQDVAVWLPQLAKNAHELRLTIEQAPQMWQVVTEDVIQQLSRLFATKFLATTPWQWLAEFPRYLKAAQLRFEKLKNGGVAKDQKISEPIQSAWSAYSDLQTTAFGNDIEYQQQLMRLRWHIEELRVSIFAQQLGTKVAVSPKRVDELVRSLQSRN